MVRKRQLTWKENEKRFKKKFIIAGSGIFAVIVVFLVFVEPLNQPPAEVSRVRIENYQLFVNGEPFVIKGVSYSPTPVGQSIVAGYNWWSDPNTYQTDFPMIREMGANTIRTYDATKATKEAMDAASQNNLYIIMNYWVDWYADLSDPETRQTMIDEFVEMVHKWRDHPAVLMWEFGCEVNMFYPGDKEDWYSLLREAAQAAHEEEGKNFHPVITAEAEILHLGRQEYLSDDASLEALDAWGITIYRGASFGIFSAYQAKSDKPVILAEWGCDALDIRTMVENQDAQASYVGSLWNEIESNLGIVGGRCLGGTVFEWCDEWWKDEASSPSTHDKTGQWSAGGYYDFVFGQNNMNEEWWGITTISPGTYEKTPREAYYTLKNLWATAA